MTEMEEDMVKVINQSRRHDATINWLKDRLEHMERGSKVRNWVAMYLTIVNLFLVVSFYQLQCDRRRNVVGTVQTCGGVWLGQPGVEHGEC
jgi:hypothetical protein